MREALGVLLMVCVNLARVLTGGCLPHCCEGVIGNFHCEARGGGMKRREHNNDINTEDVYGFEIFVCFSATIVDFVVYCEALML